MILGIKDLGGELEFVVASTEQLILVVNSLSSYHAARHLDILTVIMITMITKMMTLITMMMMMMLLVWQW